MEFRGFMNEFIRSELEDVVGRENVSSSRGENLPMRPTISGSPEWSLTKVANRHFLTL